MENPLDKPSCTCYNIKQKIVNKMFACTKLICQMSKLFRLRMVSVHFVGVERTCEIWMKSRPYWRSCRIRLYS